MKPSRKPVKGQKLDTTPRLRAFKFSTKNKSDAAYRDRLRVLKTKYGVAFPFAVNAKLNGARKGAITRRLNKVVEFLNPDNRFAFVPLPPSTLKKISHRRELSKEQRTKTGVFVPKPKSGRKKTRVRVNPKTGEIQTRTGKFTSTFKKYKSADVVRDPERIIRDAKKRGAESIFVSIKGHRGKSNKYGYNLKQFMRYMNEQILPDIEDAQDDEEKQTAFRNWFGVEFVSYKWGRSTAPRNQKRKK